MSGARGPVSFHALLDMAKRGQVRFRRPEVYGASGKDARVIWSSSDGRTRFVSIQYQESATGAQLVVCASDDEPSRRMNRYALRLTRAEPGGRAERYVLREDFHPGQTVRTYPLASDHPCVPLLSELVDHLGQHVLRKPDSLPASRSSSFSRVFEKIGLRSTAEHEELVARAHRYALQVFEAVAASRAV